MPTPLIQRWPVDLATGALALAAAIGVAWTWSHGADLGMTAAWRVASSVAIAATAFGARVPLVPLLAYVLLSCSAPRYTGELEQLVRSNALDWLCGLALVGWCSHAMMTGRPSPWRHPLFAITLALFAWIGVSWLAARIARPDLLPFPLHHPKLFLHAIVLCLVASTSLDEPRNSWFAAAALCVATLIRLAIQAPLNLHLESDASFLGALVLPMALLGFWHARQPIVRLILAAGIVGSAVTLALAQNRAAGAGVILAMVALARHRAISLTSALAAGTLAVVIAFVLFPLDRYVARFTALWDPGATHSTANLDRQSARERLDLWSGAWAMMSDQPILGVGPGHFAHHVERYAPGSGQLPAHNNFAGMAAETGVPGLALYVAAFVGALIVLERQIRRSGGEWPAAGGRALQASLVAYLAAGFFITRHDLPLAYLLVGWAIALATVQVAPVRATKHPAPIGS